MAVRDGREESLRLGSRVIAGPPGGIVRHQAGDFQFHPHRLIQAAHRSLAPAGAGLRPAVPAALAARPDDVREALQAEEREERRKDRDYWAPLKREPKEFGLGRGGERIALGKRISSR
jgi:hypothetical protein